MSKTKLKEIKKEVEIEENDEVEEVKQQLKQELKGELKEKLNIKIEGEKSIWGEIVKKFYGLNEEITVEINRDSLRIKEVDTTHVVMADMIIRKKAFDEYKVNMNSKVGINLTKLYTHLMMFRGDVSVVNCQNQLVFTGDSGKTSKMGLITVVDYDFKVPNLSYAVEIKTPAEPVKTMIEIAEKWGQDYLKFIVKDKKLHILIEDETDNARFPIGTITKLDGYDGDFQTLYSTDYLKLIMQFQANDEIFLKFGKDIPINIHYDDEKIAVTYLLAPRIEKE